MPDIYDILSKHFLNETSEQEEADIKNFRDEYPLEYDMLKKLWQKGEIKIRDFNSSKAWMKMQDRMKEGRKPKVVKMAPFRKIMRIAAVIAILIMGGYTAHYLVNVLPGKHIITVAQAPDERGREITLSDGTIVWLNKNSTLAFTKKFTGETRNVKLTGEAFFKVYHNENKPFVITTANASVKVLGTSFNVKTGEDKTKVVVATGKVQVSNSIGTAHTIITPGLSAEVTAEKVVRFKTADPNYLAWKTGKFTFNNTPLKQVIDDLNTWYDNKFVIVGDEVTDCRFTANFNKTGIPDILETLKLTCNVEIIEKDGMFIIKK